MNTHWPLENPQYLTEQLVTYIGNKRKLLNFIEEEIVDIKRTLKKDKLVILDGFAGTGVVSRMLKAHSSLLHSNDLEPYARVIGDCYLTNRSAVPMSCLEDAVSTINAEKARADFGAGFIEQMYAPKNDHEIQDGERVFYTHHNAVIIDNMRRMIDTFPANLRSFLLGPLLHKASVHANTSGVFKGFYKNSETKRGQFGGNAANCLDRITKEITLPLPVFSQFDCDWQMHQSDVDDLIRSDKMEVDVAYFDPPYNQHPYGSNYFMLNIIESYQRPEAVSKVSGIPEIWNKSAYNKAEQARQAFNNLILHTRAKFILVSYSDDGILSLEELSKIFEQYGSAEIKRRKYNTFRGSRNLANRSKMIDEVIFVIEKN